MNNSPLAEGSATSLKSWRPLLKYLEKPSMITLEIFEILEIFPCCGPLTISDENVLLLSATLPQIRHEYMSAR